MVFCVFQAQNLAASFEKKQKKIDQEIAQWKAKVDEVQAELEASQRESRSNSTEVRILVFRWFSGFMSGTERFPFSRSTNSELNWKKARILSNNSDAKRNHWKVNGS